MQRIINEPESEIEEFIKISVRRQELITLRYKLNGLIDATRKAYPAARSADKRIFLTVLIKIA